MTLLQAIVLGLIQGLTEFLPVSSSGHWVLGGVWLGLKEPHLWFDIVVHAATLLATVLFYRQSLLAMTQQLLAVLRPDGQTFAARLAENPEAKLALLIVAGTIPTGLIGVLFKDPLQALFGEPRLAAGMLLVTAGLLVTTRFAKPGHIGVRELKVHHALLIGVIQGMAIVPGISRAGSTIALALLLGVERELAARFSFLLSLPAILGAVVLQLGDDASGHLSAGVLASGFVSAAITGVLALALLVPVVKRGKLHWFAAYLVPMGVCGLIWL